MEKIHTEGRMARDNKSGGRAVLLLREDTQSIPALVYPDRASKPDRVVRGRLDNPAIGLVFGALLIAPFWLLVWAMWLLAGLWW